MKKLNQILSYAIWGWLGSIAMMLLITISYGVFPEDINGGGGHTKCANFICFWWFRRNIFRTDKRGKVRAEKKYMLEKCQGYGFYWRLFLVDDIGFFLAFDSTLSGAANSIHQLR